MRTTPAEFRERFKGEPFNPDDRGRWPKFPRDWHAYEGGDIEDHEARFTPTPHDLDLLLPVLARGRGLDHQARLIVRDHALGYSPLATSERLHMPLAAVARRYAAALDVVCRAALGS